LLLPALAEHARAQGEEVHRDGYLHAQVYPHGGRMMPCCARPAQAQPSAAWRHAWQVVRPPRVPPRCAAHPACPLAQGVCSAWPSVSPAHPERRGSAAPRLTAPVLSIALVDRFVQHRNNAPSYDRFHTERTSRRAWFLTALGRAAVRSLVLA